MCRVFTEGNCYFNSKRLAITMIAEADEMVFGYTIHNAGSGMYECTLCNGTVQKHKSYLIQRHLYDHFNIYFHRCELCHDIFRFATQFKEHKEAHRKLMDRQEEEQEKQRTSKGKNQ